MPRNQSEGTRAPNGASSIYQDKKGKWHGRVTVGIRDDGKPDRRHIESWDRRVVTKKVRELEHLRSQGSVTRPGKAMTVEQWLTHWVENIAAPTVRATTMVGYRTSVYRHLNPGLGAHRLDRLEPEHLERLYVRMRDSGLKPGTAHLAHRTMRVALNEAVKRRHLVSNPAKVARPPRVAEEEIVPFTKSEARKSDVTNDYAKKNRKAADHALNMFALLIRDGLVAQETTTGGRGRPGTRFKLRIHPQPYGKNGETEEPCRHPS